MPTITGRSLKVTVMLDAASVLTVAVRDGATRIMLNIRLPDRSVSADIATRSLRKAQAAIAEHGVDSVACIIQGRLTAGDLITEAGLVAQVKTPKVPAPVAA